MSRRIELVTGLLAGVFGLVALSFALFGLRYGHGSNKPTTSGAKGLIEFGLEPITIVFFVVAALTVLGVAIGAYLHSRGGIRAGLVLIWACAVLLVALAIFSLASVGILLLPAVISALTTATVGSWKD